MSQLTILSGNEIVLKVKLVHNERQYDPGSVLTINNVIYDSRFAACPEYSGVVFDTKELEPLHHTSMLAYFPIEKQDWFEDRYPLSDRTIEEWPVD